MTDISLPHWDDPGGDDVWQRVDLDGRTMPGLARVSVRAARKIDSRSAAGRNGARLVDKGYEPAKVKITLQITGYDAAGELRGSGVDELDALGAALPSLSYRTERRTTYQRAAAGTTRTGATREVARTDPTFIGPLAEATPAPRGRGTRQTVTHRDRAPVRIFHPQTALLGIAFVYVESIEIGELRGGVLEVTLECLEYNPDYNRATTSATPRPRAEVSNIPMVHDPYAGGQNRANTPRDNGAADP